jgi:hypothetical protein
MDPRVDAGIFGSAASSAKSCATAAERERKPLRAAAGRRHARELAQPGFERARSATTLIAAACSRAPLAVCDAADREVFDGRWQSSALLGGEYDRNVLLRRPA